MGLTLNSYTVMDSLVSINNAYLNIRDIRTTKDIININGEKIIYNFEFIYNISKDTKNLYRDKIVKTSETPYSENLWELAYKNIKEELTNKKIEFSDVL